VEGGDAAVAERAAPDPLARVGVSSMKCGLTKPHSTSILSEGRTSSSSRADRPDEGEATFAISQNAADMFRR